MPDVKGQVSADAVATLQNHGFRTTTQQKPDSVVPPDHVIGTDPVASSSVKAGAEITVNVSTGPEQREVPDVSALSFGDAVQKLKAAGFSVFKQSDAPSTPELKDKVVGTNPPANQTSAITNEITVIVGSGPESRAVPDVSGQTVDQAQQNLTVYGFTRVTQAEVDSPRPAGTILSTNPPTGQAVPLDTIIELRVSRGNQFTMPDLTGQFWVDAEPNLRALGWTGVLIKGADAQNSGQRTNAVASQTPAAGSGANFDAPITLNFAS